MVAHLLVSKSEDRQKGGSNESVLEKGLAILTNRKEKGRITGEEKKKRAFLQLPFGGPMPSSKGEILCNRVGGKEGDWTIKKVAPSWKDEGEWTTIPMIAAA